MLIAVDFPVLETIIHSRIEVLCHTGTGRWGRNIETPGEDPYVSGEYATNFVKGFQESSVDEDHLLASACCKHYVANSVEHSTEDGMTWDRFEIDSEVTMQDLMDSYMPAFQSCVEKGRVSGLMCSLNAVNSYLMLLRLMIQ